MIDFKKLLKEKARIQMDFGCGPNCQEGWIGIDRRKLPNVDIIQDLQDFPWKIPSNCCHLGLLSHVYEHIEPKHRLSLMDEFWRVMKLGGQLMIASPYATSMGAFQDPTHYTCPNEASFTYFDPNCELYNVYKPKPWRLIRNEYQVNGSLNVILVKIDRIKDAKDNKDTCSCSKKNKDCKK